MENKKIKIAFLLDYINSEYSEFLAESARECCERVNAECFLFQIGSLKNRNNEYDYQNMAVTAFLKKNNIDGIIFNSVTQTHNIDFQSYVSYLNSYYPIPIVNIGNEIPDIPSVIVRYEVAFQSLLEHVIKDVGARKILLLSANSHSEEVLKREKLFWQVMDENKIPFSDVTVIKTCYSYSSAMQELKKYTEDSKNKLLKEKKSSSVGAAGFSPKEYFPFDAVIAFNDDMASACIDFAKENNLKVPDDFVVTGFDDLRKAHFLEPSLSTVNQMVFQQGYIAVRTLYDIILGKPVPLLQTVDGKAILRQSTGASAYFNKVFNRKYIEIDRASMAISTADNPSLLKWYNNRTQIYNIAQLYMDMKSELTEERAVNHISENLINLGFNFSAVVVYKEPIECSDVFDYFHLPHEAYVISYYNKAENVAYKITKDLNKILFDPNDSILPSPLDDYFNSKNAKTVVVTTLYTGKYQYGYVLVELTNYDFGAYELIRKAISNVIFTLHTIKIGETDEELYKQQYAVLDRIAHTDELTGILNRRGLFDFGGKTLELSKSMQQKGLVVFCDMDGLKKINDNFGHEAGDKAIIAEAGILKSSFRATDIVARIGGDEFVIISPGLSPDFFQRIREKVQEKCIRWTEDSNSLFVLSISLGFVEYPFEGSYDLTILLSAADALLYQEKRRKKGLQ